MRNDLLREKDRNVKVGDRVAIQGNYGVVTEVYRNDTVTEVRVHFDEDQDIARYGQYQDKFFGGFYVLDEEEE